MNNIIKMIELAMSSDAGTSVSLHVTSNDGSDNFRAELLDENDDALSSPMDWRCHLSSTGSNTREALKALDDLCGDHLPDDQWYKDQAL